MKILTAIGNPYINEKLSKYEKIEVVGKDIQYQEGILEILENQKDIDILLLSNELPEEYDFKELIRKIKKLKETIEIIIFLKEKNEDIENFLNSKNIYKIYYLDDIDFDEFIDNFTFKIKNENTEISKEINNLRDLILNSNKNIEINREETSSNLKKGNKKFDKNKILDLRL